MSSVAFIYDPIFLEHDTGDYHPENADRLRAIIEAVQPFGEKLLWLAPKEITLAQIRSVHPQEHIQEVKFASTNEEAIDADTQVSSASYDAALMAIGAGIKAVDSVLSQEAKSVFCAVRPPGHHATTKESMGFCLFNNIAITAKYAQSVGYDKVMIVDFDVHHGNGTQEIFYSDATVFYFSSHQYPAFPGTGRVDETGEGKGKGYTHNFPLQAYSSDDNIVPIYETYLLEDIQSFQPDIILVSAGYDLHKDDPLAQIQASTEGIRKIVEAIMEHSDVPKIFMLEGGYNLSALAESVAQTLKVMLKHS